MSIQRLETGKRLSEAVVFNGTVYLTGKVENDNCAADIYIQTQQTLASIDRILAENKSDKSRILMATIYLTNMDTFADMNRAWEEWVVSGSTPARAAVEVSRLAGKEYGVEISVTAAQHAT
jgi:enamine deaminase RidA (YjgF/YER057c/UK114 family)